MPDNLAWKQKGTVIRRPNAEPPARRSSAETLCQPRASPTSSSSKAKDHSPLRLTHSERRNWGRGYSGRGTAPEAGPVSLLPEMVDLLADAAVVDLADAVQDLVGELWHIRGGYVVVYLVRTLRPRDGAGDRRVHEDPA